LAERAHWHECHAQIAAHEQESTRWQSEIERATTQLQQAQAERARLEDEDRTAREQREQANQTQLDLAAPMQALSELDRMRHELAGFDAQLQRFAPELDQQRADLESAAALKRELDVALPWLEQWAKACEEWHAARKK